jgi:hypothetical protein
MSTSPRKTRRIGKPRIKGTSVSPRKSRRIGKPKIKK